MRIVKWKKKGETLKGRQKKTEQRIEKSHLVVNEFVTPPCELGFMLTIPLDWFAYVLRVECVHCVVDHLL